MKLPDCFENAFYSLDFSWPSFQNFVACSVVIVSLYNGQFLIESHGFILLSIFVIQAKFYNGRQVNAMAPEEAIIITMSIQLY